MKITHQFDSGSIEVVTGNDPQNIQLNLKQDNNDETRQWFHFRLDTTANQSHQINIINAGQSTFAKGWQNYQAVASYDQISWFRVPTEYDGEQLKIVYTPEQSSVYYAYFTPYSSKQHQALIAKSASSAICDHEILGHTADGNTIDLLIIGEQAKHKVWITARQHPGETMAQWYVEGLLKALLSESTLSQDILAQAVFYILPNMNPDGSARGNHRTNARGVNLNRQWSAPSEADCPEVFYVRQAMLDTGVDLFFDIHGDEEIPYNFMLGGSSSERLAKQAADFKQNYVRANDDFQVEFDYGTFDYENEGKGCCGPSKCGTNKLTTATAFVENQFNCLSLLLEMPFIDNANHPDDNVGWSAMRSSELGKALLEPIAEYFAV